MTLPRSKKRLRALLMEEQGGRCAYCGEEMTILRGPRLATLDHVTSLVAGGLDAEANIVLACWQCNRAKGCMTAEQLRRLADQIDFYASAARLLQTSPVYINGERYRFIPKTRAA